MRAVFLTFLCAFLLSGCSQVIAKKASAPQNIALDYTLPACEKKAGAKREVLVANVRVLGASSRAILLKEATSFVPSHRVKLQEFLDTSLQKGVIDALSKSCEFSPTLTTQKDLALRVALTEFYLEIQPSNEGESESFRASLKAFVSVQYLKNSAKNSEKMLDLSVVRNGEINAVNSLFNALYTEIFKELRR